MTAAVLGLGPSLALFSGKEELVFGVNDIFSRRPVDYLVVVDPPGRFPTERMVTIIKSRPKKFYSHYQDHYGSLPGFELIRFHPARGKVETLGDPEKTPKSNNSPFVAVCLAYQLGARRIILYGVDFTNHPNIKGAVLSQTLRDFEALRIKLNKSGATLLTVNRESPLARVIPVLEV